MVGGWEAYAGVALRDCMWYSLEILPSDAPWFYAAGKGSKLIAAAELIATTICVTLFAPKTRENAIGTLDVTSAFTDNRGNTYAAAKLHSTKFPLSCVVMELASQLESRGMWLDLRWTPRESNKYADALTNGDFKEFSSGLRLASSWSDVGFLVLPRLLEVGTQLKDQTAALRAEAPKRKQRKTNRQDRLRITDPW